ncbi:SGS-domain-containing protein, partial [Cantharellus anzutake]|uniref:SGS-domain-containing protein n=1 Tax=Cantharellus anzutake TaxID=1750568 RepID=UPI00190300AB
RHAFFETDQKVELSIFVKNAIPDDVKIAFEPRKFFFKYGGSELVLDPLRSTVDPGKCTYRVGQVKIEVVLAKVAAIRWGSLVQDINLPDPNAPFASSLPSESQPKSGKNWEALASSALENEGKDKTSAEDPNAGGDAAVNGFFQQLYANADEDTKRAMLKSYTESGGTSLSTDWNEVSRGKVEVRPPSGAEERKW